MKQFIPQIIILVYYLILTIKGALQAGTIRKKGLTKFGYVFGIVRTIFFGCFLAYFGFFDHLGIPQWIYLILYMVTFLSMLDIKFVAKVYSPDEPRKNTAYLVLFFLFLFWWGGFFDTFIAYLHAN